VFEQNIGGAPKVHLDKTLQYSLPQVSVYFNLMRGPNAAAASSGFSIFNIFVPSSVCS
jgi:hypothetical protein